MRNFVLIVILGMVSVQCRKAELSEKELGAYILDDSNGLHKKMEESDISIEVTYKPSDFILKQEIEDKSYKRPQVDSIREKLKAMDYFTMKLTRNNKDLLNSYVTNPSVFENAVNYLSFQIGNDIKLIVEQDTLPVQDFLFFRGFEMDGASEVMLAFKSELRKRKGDAQFLFHDNFFQTGSHAVEFETQAIRNIPSLIIK